MIHYNYMEQPIFNSFVQQFLRQEIINTQFIFIDFWSIVHFNAGIVLGFLLTKFFKKKSWLIALGLLLLYEVVELFLNGIFFAAESPIDTTWDIIIGMAGFVIGVKILKYVKI